MLYQIWISHTDRCRPSDTAFFFENRGEAFMPGIFFFGPRTLSLAGSRDPLVCSVSVQGTYLIPVPKWVNFTAIRLYVTYCPCGSLLKITAFYRGPSKMPRHFFPWPRFFWPRAKPCDLVFFWVRVRVRNPNPSSCVEVCVKDAGLGKKVCIRVGVDSSIYLTADPCAAILPAIFFASVNAERPG